ncbi:MAG: amino acid ABC transporter ATP-binding protein [Elusimicrobia bacterium]|nr:amino acid ABC transporter ATP-binding protein [Elusimicrobiota bacterium]
MLIGEDLRKSYRELVALDKVNVSVTPGRITVLIGPSGSGKTTLLRTLALLDPPDSGEVMIDNLRYSFPSGKKAWQTPPWPRVTVVFQQFFLWPHLTLKKNILLPLKLTGGDPSSLGQMIDLFGMQEFIDRYPNEASIGQRQRAALARAVMLNPAYILLDEITSALDVEQTTVILKYLLSLRDRGIGLLVVTHLIGFARQLLGRREGDQILFLDHGQVLEFGDINVLDNPKHDRLRQFLSAMETAS